MRKYDFSIFLTSAALVLFLALPSSAALLGNTSQATLTLSPQSGNFNANDTFAVNIFVNSGGQYVNTVAAYLNYDKTHFQAVSIDTTGSLFSMEAENMIDAINGKIKITRGVPTPGVNITNGLVAKINFKALSNITPASDNLTFDFTPGSALASNVFKDDGLGTTFLSGVYNAKYTVGTGGQTTYSNGSLLRASNSDKVYLIENGQKRWVPSAEVFISNGYSWSNIVIVEPSALSQYPDGPNVLLSTSSILEGGLIRAQGDIDVYIVKYVGTKKFKRLILSPSVFNSYQHLKWSDIKDVDKSIVDSFTTSELVRAIGDPKVYKLYPAGDTGEKRWIKTADAFVGMGFDWDAVYQINQVDRDSYVEGSVLECCF
ncbi:cohesin domain-containing protein [Patescibacteria group bacterium]|nr:cohesin domain-containing protein [Patescibacteria group bacterium]